MKRKRFAETFRNCPSLFTHSIFFRGENSFDSTKDVIFLKQANARFATVVAGNLESSPEIFLLVSQVSQPIKTKKDENRKCIRPKRVCLN